MRVLQITGTDAAGTRFTGISQRNLLAERGVDSRHYVWRKETDAAGVIKAYDFPFRDTIHGFLARQEEARSLQSTLYRYWWTFPFHASYRWADLVHYHIIHDGYFSMDVLPRLTRRKPSVWTLHDPWAMTGHCIHPMGCERWKIGCGQCPDLKMPFKLIEDRTHENFLRKQKAYRRSRLDLIVSSQWMLDLVKASPLTQHFDTHVVPFGLDTERFRPRPAAEARRRFGILPGRKVLFLRAFSSVHKGLPFIREAVGKLKTARPVTILTVQESGHFDFHLGRHQVIEHGWTTDEDTLIDAFTACDIFLMPSLAESFGMMAIEAMACGKPVISFDGTALPAVTHAPDCGVSVPAGDSDALAAAIDRLVDNDDERLRRGALGRKIAEEQYGLAKFVDRLQNVYAAAMEKHNRR